MKTEDLKTIVAFSGITTMPKEDKITMIIIGVLLFLQTNYPAHHVYQPPQQTQNQQLNQQLSKPPQKYFPNNQVFLIPQRPQYCKKTRKDVLFSKKEKTN